MGVHPAIVEARMQLGVVFPQTEIGADPAAIKDYAQTAEHLGYVHLLVYDHVLGADTSIAERHDWRGPYTHHHQFHEPFVLFGYLAALTRLELVTGILILPQRQTALVAKQAAEVDVLTGGRLRLGVGVGWNAVEYEGLDEDFRTRGRRMDEQVQLLRRLWTEPVVDFRGRFDDIPQAGINPLPIQRPIPIWMGGMADAVLERIAKYADGWFPQFRPGGDTARQYMDKLRGLVRDAGRQMSEIGIEGRFTASGSPDEWRTAMDEWRALGATHLSVNTMGLGFTSPGQHIEMLGRVKEGLT
jgi:probable F420-dependent oxidoreductase